MDEVSETRLGVGQDLTRWRGFQAGLVNELQRQGAALIVFDLQFLAPHPEHDGAFAEAMLKAGNVLVSECVQKFRRGDRDFFGREECSESNKRPPVEKDGEPGELSEKLVVMRSLLPYPLLEKSALDHAPFHLTNDPGNAMIRESWAFFDPLANLPSLPVLTWFYYLQRTGALTGTKLPEAGISRWLVEQRQNCLSDPDKFKKDLDKNNELQNAINVLICQGDSRYLDFYGPPQTFRIESYSDVYQGKVSNLKDKVVFIGKANRQYSAGKTDFFSTPFTTTQTGKIAGVEIMATQFANLYEGRSVNPAPYWWLIVLTFGLIVSWLLMMFSGLAGITISLLVGGCYAGFAIWSFNRSGLWLPVMVPLLIQLPLAWLISLYLSRQDLIKDRKEIYQMVQQHFPLWVNHMPADERIRIANRVEVEFVADREVTGICLATDIERYTKVATRLPAHELWDLLKAYYKIIGQPVSLFNGKIANIQGDAMMALWIDASPDFQRQSACAAAVEIVLAVKQFNDSSGVAQFPTRIGLHEGDFMLGSGDAGGFKFFNPFGDTVNTASRIEGVNKFLGTQILASKAVAENLTHIVTRPVGPYRLRGREDQPIELVEIVGMEADVSESRKTLIRMFSFGLAAFQRGDWDTAISLFEGILKSDHRDGPTLCLMNMAREFKENPPENWEGVVTLEGR